MSQVILFGTTACLNQQKLRAYPKTPWEIQAIPDDVLAEKRELQNVVFVNSPVSV